MTPIDAIDHCLSTIDESDAPELVAALRTAIELLPAEGDPWAEDPDYPVADWQGEVRDDATRLGYAPWTAMQRAADLAEHD